MSNGACDFRQALANALAAAPSMWTLGNAGMGALQVSIYGYGIIKVVLFTGLVVSSFPPYGVIGASGSCCRDLQKTPTQPLLLQHPKLFMNSKNNGK